MKNEIFHLGLLFLLLAILPGIVHSQQQIPNNYSPFAVSNVVKTQPSYVSDKGGKGIILSESFDGTTFPPTAWTAEAGSGSYNWVRVTSGTHPTCSPHSGAGMAWYDCWDAGSGQWAALTSSVVNCAGNTGTFIAGFWIMHDGTYTGDHIEVYINTTPSLSGATLIGDVQNNDGTTGWGQHEFYIPGTYSTATNYIIFKGISAYGNGMFIDDIYVTSPEANDVGLTAITAPLSAIVIGSVTPKVVVKNFGFADQTNVPVKYTIGVGGTPVVATVASIASGATTNVSFPAWTANIGLYDFIFYTDLADDSIHTNDTMKRTVMVINSYTSAFCFKDGTQPATFIVENPQGGFTNKGVPTTWHSRGGAYARFHWSTTCFWYVLGSDFNLYAVDTATGVPTLIGPTGFTGTFLSGLAYDRTTHTLFASGLTGTYPTYTFTLYTLNMDSGVATLVATCPTPGCFLELACSDVGQLYTIESVPFGNGKLYRVDKTNAQLTLVGNDLGGIISSDFQDIDFTETNDLYFTTSMGSDGVLDGLYTINTTTGIATLVSAFPATNTQVVGFALERMCFSSVHELIDNKENISILPNPVKDEISVISLNNEPIQTIKLITLSGQVIYSEEINHFAASINTSQFNAGFYIIEVTTKSGIFTKKIVKSI